MGDRSPRRSSGLGGAVRVRPALQDLSMDENGSSGTMRSQKSPLRSPLAQRDEIELNLPPQSVLGSFSRQRKSSYGMGNGGKSSIGGPTRVRTPVGRTAKGGDKETAAQSGGRGDFAFNEENAVNGSSGGGLGGPRRLSTDDPKATTALVPGAIMKSTARPTTSVFKNLHGDVGIDIVPGDNSTGVRVKDSGNSSSSNSSSIRRESGDSNGILNTRTSFGSVSSTASGGDASEGRSSSGSIGALPRSSGLSRGRLSGLNLGGAVRRVATTADDDDEDDDNDDDDADDDNNDGHKDKDDNNGGDNITGESESNDKSAVTVASIRESSAPARGEAASTADNINAATGGGSGSGASRLRVPMRTKVQPRKTVMAAAAAARTSSGEMQLREQQQQQQQWTQTSASSSVVARRRATQSKTPTAQPQPNCAAPISASASGEWSLDHFSLGKPLGRGKFGNVYLAKQKSSRTQVALKVLFKQPLQSAGCAHALRREVEIHCRLKHRNIVGLHGYFQDAKQVYLILEFLSGGELYKQVARVGGFVDEATCIRYMRDISSAVAFMHQRHVMHRDIKPENILVGADGRLCLADFGWAAHCPPGHENRYTMCGTPEYISPEMLCAPRSGSKTNDSSSPTTAIASSSGMDQGGAHSLGVDLWAMGILMFELMAGRTPFWERRRSSWVQPPVTDSGSAGGDLGEEGEYECRQRTYKRIRDFDGNLDSNFDQYFAPLPSSALLDETMGTAGKENGSALGSARRTSRSPVRRRSLMGASAAGDKSRDKHADSRHVSRGMRALVAALLRPNPKHRLSASEAKLALDALTAPAHASLTNGAPSSSVGAEDCTV